MALTSEMRRRFFGVGAVMVANCCFLGNSFIVGRNPMTAGEVMVTRSLLQILVFGTFSMHKRKKDGPPGFAWSQWLMVAAANLAFAVCQMGAYTACQMLPLSDFVVLAFTSPGFALVFSGLCLRKPIRCVEVTICMVIVMGASLVTQPTFIFGENSAAIHYKQYTLGALIVIVCAMMGGLFPVLMSKCKEVPSCFYMAVGGAVTLVVGAIHRMALTNTKVDHYGSLLIGLMIVVGTNSMMGVLMEQMAVAATCPVLVSIVRSLEVVMALIIDIITRDNFVHVDDMRFWYKVIGACTVTLCVTSMSVADKIHQGLTACTRAIIGQERERSAYTIIDGEDFQDDERISDPGVSGEWEDSERQPIMSMPQPDS